MGVNGGRPAHRRPRGVHRRSPGFYFREYELRFAAEDGFEILDELLEGLAPVRFHPVFVNAQAGVTFKF